LQSVRRCFKGAVLAAHAPGMRAVLGAVRPLKQGMELSLIEQLLICFNHISVSNIVVTIFVNIIDSFNEK
jgi:hypothetical protein